MVAGGMESMSNVPMFENRTAPVYGNRVVKVTKTAYIIFLLSSFCAFLFTLYSDIMLTA